MASSSGKKGGGRVTAKGTQPPAKAPRGPGAGGAKGAGKAEPAAPTHTVNRQMRRMGNIAEPQEPDTGRMKLVLGIGGAVTAALVLASIAVFHLSGTWIGLLGLAAGVATGLAVAMNKTFLADKGRIAAITIAAVGVIATAIGVSGIVDFHWPFAALIGCGLGALIAELSVQQMTPPQSPPQSALALLRRTGAQLIPAPSTGSCVWATPDARVRIIVGASVKEGVTGDDVLKDRSVRRSRQRAAVLARRMAPLGVEAGIVCVVDTGITTIRDGDDIICSAAGLNKALSR